MSKILEWFKDNKVKCLVVMALISINYIAMPFLGYDNPLEQSIEWVIKAWSGVEVDLTPETITENFPLEGQASSDPS